MWIFLKMEHSTGGWLLLCNLNFAPVAATLSTLKVGFQRSSYVLISSCEPLSWYQEVKSSFILLIVQLLLLFCTNLNSLGWNWSRCEISARRRHTLAFCATQTLIRDSGDGWRDGGMEEDGGWGGEMWREMWSRTAHSSSFLPQLQLI